MVHASTGRNEPASEHLKSEPAIVAGMARATLGERSVVEWEDLVADYDRIRDAIEAVFPIFQGYNARIRVPGGFHLTSTARERIWVTPYGQGELPGLSMGLGEDPDREDPDVLVADRRCAAMTSTIPTIYSLSDRYRGVFGRRDVLFIKRPPRSRSVASSRGRPRRSRDRFARTGWNAVVSELPAGRLMPFPARQLRRLLPGGQSAGAAHAYDADELHTVVQRPFRSRIVRRRNAKRRSCPDHGRRHPRATAIRVHASAFTSCGRRSPSASPASSRCLSGLWWRTGTAGLSRPDALLDAHLRTRLRHGRHHRRCPQLRDRRQLGRLLAVGVATCSALCSCTKR